MDQTGQSDIFSHHTKPHFIVKTYQAYLKIFIDIYRSKQIKINFPLSENILII